MCSNLQLAREGFHRIKCALAFKISFERIMKRNQRRWILVYGAIQKIAFNGMKLMLDNLVVAGAGPDETHMMPDYKKIDCYLKEIMEEYILEGSVFLFDLYLQKAGVLWGRLYRRWVFAYSTNPSSVSTESSGIMNILLLKYQDVASPVDTFERKLEELNRVSFVEVEVQNRKDIHTYLELLIWALSEIAVEPADRERLTQLCFALDRLFSCDMRGATF